MDTYELSIESDLVPDWKDTPEDDNAEPDDAGDDK